MTMTIRLRRRESLRSAACRRCRAWNHQYPLGTPVRYFDTGLDTRTRSAAWCLPSGEAVVLLDDVVGCVGLARLVHREIAVAMAPQEPR